jgi:hypothetical protein
MGGDVDSREAYKIKVLYTSINVSRPCSIPYSTGEDTKKNLMTSLNLRNT